MQVALFVKDLAHENFVGGLVRRVAAEEGVDVVVAVRNSAGGEGRVWSSLTAYVRDLKASVQRADVLVVAVDANSAGVAARVKHARRIVGEVVDLVLAVPDPYVERWYLLDLPALAAALGASSVPDITTTAGRDLKSVLRETVRTAIGQRPPLGGAEYGEDLAGAVDLTRACRTDRQLDSLVVDLRASLRRPR